MSGGDAEGVDASGVAAVSYQPVDMDSFVRVLQTSGALLPSDETQWAFADQLEHDPGSDSDDSLADPNFSLSSSDTDDGESVARTSGSRSADGEGGGGGGGGGVTRRQVESYLAASVEVDAREVAAIHRVLTWGQSHLVLIGATEVRIFFFFLWREVLLWGNPSPSLVDSRVYPPFTCTFFRSMNSLCVQQSERVRLVSAAATLAGHQTVVLPLVATRHVDAHAGLFPTLRGRMRPLS